MKVKTKVKSGNVGCTSGNGHTNNFNHNQTLLRAGQKRRRR